MNQKVMDRFRLMGFEPFAKSSLLTQPAKKQDQQEPKRKRSSHVLKQIKLLKSQRLKRTNSNLILVPSNSLVCLMNPKRLRFRSQNFPSLLQFYLMLANNSMTTSLVILSKRQCTYMVNSYSKDRPSEIIDANLRSLVSKNLNLLSRSKKSNKACRIALKK